MIAALETVDARPIVDIVRLRLSVGWLGERAEQRWWQSSFFGSSAASFLEPLFGGKRTSAQHLGVTEAARLVHDDHIGLGRVFHLFRLPETVEQLLAATLSSAGAEGILQEIGSEGWAMRALTELGTSKAEPKIGPVRVGSAESATLAPLTGTPEGPPTLDAFADRAWHYLDQGWELSEYPLVRNL